MKLHKDFTNNEIYSLNTIISGLDINNIQVPVSVGFYMNKNFEQIRAAAADVMHERETILRKYAKVDDVSGQFNFDDDDKLAAANRDIEEFSVLTQEISYYPVKLSALDNFNLTMTQIQALSWMIDDDLEEKEE